MFSNEKYGKVCVGKHLSDSFPIQNGLKQGGSISLLHFNFALEYTMGKAQEKYVGLKLNGAHELLANADDVNLLISNIDTIKKNTKIVIDTSKKGGLELNVKMFQSSNIWE
jgi:hypothetical protein